MSAAEAGDSIDKRQDRLYHRVDVGGPDIATALGITPEVIAWRRAAMGLDDAARARLRSAAPGAAAVIHGLIDRLYERLRAIPSTKALLTSDELVARLKAQQRAYLQELLAAELDWPYILRRLAIGEMHHRVRLAPQWYLATYAHVIAELLDALLGTAPTQADGCECICALIASVCLDASLVLDSYGRSEEAAHWLRSEEMGAQPPAPRNKAAPAPSSALVAGNGPTQIRLTADATEERRRFIGLSDDDLQRLRGLQPLIAAHTPAILEDFYAMLASRPETAALVPPDTARRLKQQVTSYWMELADGGFDRPYAASRMRIGVIHEKVGVGTASYLTGLARQLCGLARAIVRERPAPLDDLRALVRAVFFDLSFVIDAYMEARVDTLLRTEGYANQLVAGLASAVAVIDSRDCLLSANRTMLTLIGGDPGTLYRLPLESALPLPEAVNLVRSLRASGNVREVGIGRLGPRTLRCTVMWLTGHGSAEHSIALVLDDITDILRLGHDFTRQADQFEQVADAAGALLWEMDVASGTIAMINRAALDLTGFRDVFFLGRPWAWHERIPERERERFTRHAAALAAGAQAELDYPLQRADGSEIWVRTRLRGALDSDEPRLRGVTLDITAARRAETLRLEAIGKIAGGVAHTVNNALTGVMGYIDLQALELGGLPQAPLLQEALAAAHRAREMAARLLAFAGQQMLRPAPLSLSELARAAEARMRTMLGPTARLRMELDDALWICRVDREQLLTALECLAANAREALAGAGEFVVTTRNRPADSLADGEPGFGQDWVELEASDTGSGMPESVRARAMDPFFSTRSLAESAGLGLSMVHGFVAQSGGHLTLDSAPGEGTRIRMRFLRIIDAPVAAHTPLRPLVLVVEDQPEVRRLAVRMIRRLGYEVRDTGSAEEALQLATAVRPTILLTDIVIGQGTDGITLARGLADADPQLAVILTSGYAQDHFDLSRVSTGTQFLPKPFTLTMLAEALQATVRGR